MDKNIHEIHFGERTGKLSNQDIDDIMSASLDGGITSDWCRKVEVVGDYLGEYASEQISRGGKLKFFIYDEKGKPILTLDKLLNGVKLALSQGYGADWFDVDGNFDTSFCFDAIQGDIVVQFALFGEVVYS